MIFKSLCNYCGDQECWGRSGSGRRPEGSPGGNWVELAGPRLCRVGEREKWADSGTELGGPGGGSVCGQVPAQC